VDACDGDKADDSGTEKADDEPLALLKSRVRRSSSICFRTRRISLVMYCCRWAGLDSEVLDERGVTKGSTWPWPRAVSEREDRTIGPGVSIITPVSASRRVRCFRLRRKKKRNTMTAMIASMATMIPIAIPIGTVFLLGDWLVRADAVDEGPAVLEPDLLADVADVDAELEVGLGAELVAGFELGMSITGKLSVLPRDRPPPVSLPKAKIKYVPGSTIICTSTKPAFKSTLSAILDALEATPILKNAPTGSPSSFVKLILVGPAVRNCGVEITKARAAPTRQHKTAAQKEMARMLHRAG